MRNVSEIAMLLDVVTRIYCTRSPGGGMITWKSEAATLSFRDSLVRTPLDILCFFIRAVNGSGVTSFARSTGDDFCSGRNRRGAAPRRTAAISRRESFSSIFPTSRTFHLRGETVPVQSNGIEGTVRSNF